MKTSWLLPALVVALAAGLRFLDLGAESFWLDEVTMALISIGGLDALLDALSVHRPILYPLASQALATLFGTSEAAARSLSALAGTAAVALLIPLGTQLFGRPVGLIAALLLACSEFNIYYSQDHRYYALLVCLTVASMLFFVRLIADWRRVDAIAYVLATVAMFHTHPFALTIIAAQNLHVLASARAGVRWSGWLKVQALIVLGLLPALVVRVFLVRATGIFGSAWLPEMGWKDPLKTLGRFIFSIRSLPDLFEVAAGLGVVVLAGGAWHLVRGSRPGPFGRAVGELLGRRSELRLTVLWLICPIAIPWLFSILIKPIYQDRYTIGASPALFLLVALGCWSLRQQVPVFLSLVAVLSPGLIALSSYYPQPVKEQWREAAAYVADRADAGDAIVFLESASVRNAFSWYYRGPGRPCLVARDLNDTEALHAVRACMGESGRFWLLLRFTINPAPARALFLTGDPPGFELVGGVRDFEQVAVRLYALN